MHATRRDFTKYLTIEGFILVARQPSIFLLQLKAANKRQLAGMVWQPITLRPIPQGTVVNSLSLDRLQVQRL